MTCLVCGANAEQITSTIYGMNVVCPTCGECGITGSVLSMDQWQRLESRERNDAFNKAKASVRPGACPMITTNLLTADTELGDYDENPVILFKSGELPPPFNEA